MPVRYDKKSKTWCVGSKCGYKSQSSARRAYRAYQAKRHKTGGKKK